MLAWAFSSCGGWGLLFIAGLGPLTVVVSLVADVFYHLPELAQTHVH